MTPEQAVHSIELLHGVYLNSYVVLFQLIVVIALLSVILRHK